MTLITDHTSGVTAKVLPGGAQGVVKPKVGDPEDLILDFIDSTRKVGAGQTIVTAGWRARGFASQFPPNLPIGEVTDGLDRRAGGEPAGAPAALRRPRQPRLRPGADRGLARMIVTPRIFVRLAAIAIVGVLLQLSFFSRVELFGTSPDLLPVVVIALGLLGGSMTGAVAGFSIGLLVDCLLVAPLGGTSLVLLTTGYLAGLFRERFEIHSALVPPLLCMGLTLVAELGFAAVQLMLGVDAPVSVLIVRDMLLKSIYAFFLGWPIYYGLRRALRPALVEEPRVRRRGQPTVLGA